MPLPSGMTAWHYAGVTTPLVTADPAQSRPIGLGPVAEGGNILKIQVSLPQFSGPVDVYLALYMPAVNPSYWFIDQYLNIYPHTSRIVTWRDNTSWPVAEALYGDVDISGLPAGAYYVYLLVTPQDSFSGYYLWDTSFSMPLPPVATAPAAPSNLQAVAQSTTAIGLTWADNSSNETGFRVRYRQSGGSLWFQLPDLAAGVTSTSATGLTPAMPYEFYVTAFNSVGESAASNTATATTQTPAPAGPSAPSGLTVTPVDKSGTGLRLAWADNAGNETGYKVNRSLSASGGFVEVASLAAGVTSWNDANLTPCTAYYYQVYAYNADGNSGNASGNATTAPAAPAAVVAAGGKPLLGIYLDWAATACATQYRVYECDNAGYTYTLLAGRTITQNSVDLTDAAPGKYLFYRVSAVDAAGHEGAQSCTTASGAAWGGATSANDTCHAAVGWPASPAPANIWASVDNYTNQIIVGWSAVQLTWRYMGVGSDTYAGRYKVWYSLDNTQPLYANKPWTALNDWIVTPNANPVNMPVDVNPGNTVHFKISTDGHPGYPSYVTGRTAVSTVSSRPPAPLLTVSAYYPSLIMVGWSSITGATSYEVQRSTSSSSGFTTIRSFSPSTTWFNNTTTDTSYPISTGVNYWYRVRAINGSTAGPWSTAEMGNAIQFLP